MNEVVKVKKSVKKPVEKMEEKMEEKVEKPKKGRLVKGSIEAKEYMNKIRSLRKPKEPKA